MQTIVLANGAQKEEWMKSGMADVAWAEDFESFVGHPDADAYLDLLYENSERRNAGLRQLLPAIVVISSVTDRLSEIDPAFVRINAWPTFLSAHVMEVACAEAYIENCKVLFAAIGKKIQFLPDATGFVTARVVSMIVNEAYLALAEGVSTKEEINTAMKLGTAYPYGPFEWAEKIGLKNIVALLQKLSETEPRYSPAALLVEEANK
jgi:3-hydroxybutyryl-CoA dehydrogenase